MQENKNVRMKDIAARAGVSTVTVSKALSGQRGVSDGMRKTIIALASEMGYQAPAEKPRRTRPSYTVGLLVSERDSEEEHSVRDRLTEQVSEELSRYSSYTVIEEISCAEDRPPSMPSLLKKDSLDGLIIAGAFPDSYVRALLEKVRIPVVFLSAEPRIPGQDYVISDGYYGACLLTNHLIDQGHTKIGYIGAILSPDDTSDRCPGYIHALKAHGLTVSREWMFEYPGDGPSPEKPDFSSLLPDRLPTAFICSGSRAVRALQAELDAGGIRRPEETAIAGFDIFPSDAGTRIACTSYDTDTREMARKAVSILLRRINGDYCKKNITIVTGRLTRRERVCPVKKEPHC